MTYLSEVQHCEKFHFNRDITAISSRLTMCVLMLESMHCHVVGTKQMIFVAFEHWAERP